MKKLILATTAIAALGAGSAVAADMPIKGPAARPSCAAAQFQGGYIGVHGGGVNYTSNRSDLDGFLIDNNTNVGKDWGGIAGGQLGYNWTTCNTVWGIEVDGSWVGAKTRLNHNPNSAGDPINEVISRFDWLFTARTRAGIAMDNLLVYVTGGVAVAGFRTTWNDPSAGTTPLDIVTISETRVGWVAGFGTEWAWTDRWTLRSEVLYLDLPDRNHHVVFPSFGPADFQHSDSAWIARVALNYKFGGR